jgi:hypothetical protein
MLVLVFKFTNQTLLKEEERSQHAQSQTDMFCCMAENFTTAITLNQLWTFSIDNGNWEMLDGSDAVNTAGSYEPKGDPGSFPPGK